MFQQSFRLLDIQLLCAAKQGSKYFSGLNLKKSPGGEITCMLLNIFVSEFFLKITRYSFAFLNDKLMGRSSFLLRLINYEFKLCQNEC